MKKILLSLCIAIAVTTNMNAIECNNWLAGYSAQDTCINQGNCSWASESGMSSYENYLKVSGRVIPTSRFKYSYDFIDKTCKPANDFYKNLFKKEKMNAFNDGKASMFLPILFFKDFEKLIQKQNLNAICHPVLPSNGFFGFGASQKDTIPVKRIFCSTDNTATKFHFFETQNDCEDFVSTHKDELNGYYTDEAIKEIIEFIDNPNIRYGNMAGNGHGYCQ